VFSALSSHLSAAIPYDVLVIYARQGERLVPEIP
jgi:hypothetical protein